MQPPFVCDKFIVRQRRVWLVGIPRTLVTNISYIQVPSIKALIDPIIADIEEFMFGCDNTVPSSAMNTCANSLSDQGLLKILEPNHDQSKKTKTTPNILKKRQSNTGLQEVPPKKVLKKEDFVLKNKGENGKILGKESEAQKEKPSKRLKRAVVRKLSCVKCKPLKCAEKIKRKCKSVFTRNKAQCAAKVQEMPEVLNDSYVARIVTIKEEIVDLTVNAPVWQCWLCFGKVEDLEEFAEAEERTHLARATASFVHSYLTDEVLSSKAEVWYHSGEFGRNSQLVSEKECANKILPIIHSYYVVRQANIKITEALLPTLGCLPPEETEEDFQFPRNYLNKRIATIGNSLIKQLSTMFVRNLDFERLARMIAQKLKTVYQVDVSSQDLCSDLFGMLDSNRHLCRGDLAKELLTQIDSQQKGSSRSEIVVTPSQLEQLHDQIQVYIMIAEQQEKNMVQRLAQELRVKPPLSPETFPTSDPGISREIKSEMLVKYLPPDPKAMEGIIVVIDD